MTIPFNIELTEDFFDELARAMQRIATPSAALAQAVKDSPTAEKLCAAANLSPVAVSDPGAEPKVITIDDVRDATLAVRARIIGPDWRDRKANGEQRTIDLDSQIKDAAIQLAKKIGAAKISQLSEAQRAPFIAALDGIHIDPGTGSIVPF